MKADKELRAAIGWTDIKMREQEVRKLVDKAVVAARIDELKRIAKLMPRKSANSEHDVIAIGRVEIEDRLNQLGAKDEQI